jgi:hypothetical protein
MIFIKYNPRQIRTTNARVPIRERTIDKARDALAIGTMLVKEMTITGKRIDIIARIMPVTFVFLGVEVIISKWR